MGTMGLWSPLLMLYPVQIQAPVTRLHAVPALPPLQKNVAT